MYIEKEIMIMQNKILLFFSLIWRNNFKVDNTEQRFTKPA